MLESISSLFEHRPPWHFRYFLDQGTKERKGQQQLAEPVCRISFSRIFACRRLRSPGKWCCRRFPSQGYCQSLMLFSQVSSLRSQGSTCCKEERWFATGEFEACYNQVYWSGLIVLKVYFCGRANIWLFHHCWTRWTIAYLQPTNSPYLNEIKIPRLNLVWAIDPTHFRGVSAVGEVVEQANHV